MSYKPQTPFNVPMKILVPQWSVVNGVRKKTYPDTESVGDDCLFFGSFRTFGGTETNSNGVYSIENTAVVETWFRTDIASDCRVLLCDSGKVYEILGEPENISMRNQFLKFKMKFVGGKA